jgi:uncharacterized membrane protein
VVRGCSFVAAGRRRAGARAAVGGRGLRGARALPQRPTRDVLVPVPAAARYTHRMPLHPAVVHLPLGLALAMPFITVFAAMQLREQRRGPAVLSLVLATLLVVGAIVARQTGEDDEELAERVVPHEVIEGHETAANFFTGWSLFLLAMSGATVALANRKPGRYTAAAAVVGSLFVATTGIATGHQGGEIVYEHGGAAVHAKPGAAAAAGQAAHDND